MLGVEKGKVVLEKYNPEWKIEYEKERDNLEKLIGKYVLRIEHIGSTSIPGMKAKPIIDIAVIVEELKKDNEYIQILLNAGYEYRDDNAEKSEHLFKKTKNGLTTHFIHIIKKDSERWYNYIIFKNYLINNPAEIKNYIKLKEKLENKYKNNRKSYTEHKNKYIKNIIKKGEKNGLK